MPAWDTEDVPGLLTARAHTVVSKATSSMEECVHTPALLQEVKTLRALLNSASQHPRSMSHQQEATGAASCLTSVLKSKAPEWSGEVST